MGNRGVAIFGQTEGRWCELVLLEPDREVVHLTFGNGCLPIERRETDGGGERVDGRDQPDRDRGGSTELVVALGDYHRAALLHAAIEALEFGLAEPP